MHVTNIMSVRQSRHVFGSEGHIRSPRSWAPQARSEAWIFYNFRIGHRPTIHSRPAGQRPARAQWNKIVISLFGALVPAVLFCSVLMIFLVTGQEQQQQPLGFGLQGDNPTPRIQLSVRPFVCSSPFLTYNQSMFIHLNNPQDLQTDEG